MENLMDTIPILVSVQDEEQEVKGLFSLDADVILRNIPVEVLQENMSAICNQVIATVGHIKQVGQFKLKQVSIQVEVSAEGGVELIGTAKLGGKGAITLTFGE
jgi:hypothetical protein